MTLRRRLLALVAVVAGAAAIHYFCVLPYRCNRLKSAQTAALERAFNHALLPAGRIEARQSLQALLPCAAPICRDVSVDMLIAAGYRIVGQPREAIRFYQHALRLDERPEIYINLAAAEIAVGLRDEARNHLLRAVLFAPWTIRSIEDGALRQEVIARLIELRPENEAYIRYIDSVQLP